MRTSVGYSIVAAKAAFVIITVTVIAVVVNVVFVVVYAAVVIVAVVHQFPINRSIAALTSPPVDKSACMLAARS